MSHPSLLPAYDPPVREPASSALPSGATVASELEETWGATVHVCADLSPDRWARSTDCPGWTVHDVLAHMVGTESQLLGRPVPDPGEEPMPPYVRNPIGEANERWVRSRRHMPGEQLLAEFQEVTGARLARLRGMSDEELAAESWTPAGPGTYRDLVLIRIFDCWVHEQDIRRALGHPGHLSGPAAERSLDQVQRAMPYVVAKKAAAPEGTKVVFEIRGPTERRFGVEVTGGRGRLTADLRHPTATVLAEFEPLMALAAGRWTPGPALSDGRVAVQGDLALAKAVVDQLDFVV
jgi:uncharacterized protein (TIGR03083 family)